MRQALARMAVRSTKPQKREVIAHGLHNARLGKADIAFPHGLAVAIELLVAHFNDVAGRADNALDVVHAGVVGIFKNNDVALLRIVPPPQVGVGKGNFNAVGELAGQQMVAHQQGLQHGFGRNLESLHHKGADEQGQDQGHQKGLAVLAPQGLFVTRGRLQQRSHAGSS